MTVSGLMFLVISNC